MVALALALAVARRSVDRRCRLGAVLGEVVVALAVAVAAAGGVLGAEAGGLAGDVGVPLPTVVAVATAGPARLVGMAVTVLSDRLTATTAGEGRLLGMVARTVTRGRGIPMAGSARLVVAVAEAAAHHVRAGEALTQQLGWVGLGVAAAGLGSSRIGVVARLRRAARTSIRVG